MPEWVIAWLWVGFWWTVASVVAGLIAGPFMHTGSGDEADEVHR